MEMDEKLLKKINRNLRAVKLMMSTLFLLFFAILAVLGFIAYKVVSFTNEVNTKITNIENTTSEKLDVKAQLCDGTEPNQITRQFCN